DAATEQRARELMRRYPPCDDDPSGPAHVVRTGQPELVADVTDMLRDGGSSTGYPAMLRDLGVVSATCAPLQARGETFGAITLLATTAGRWFSAEDQVLAEETGR